MAKWSKQLVRLDRREFEGGPQDIMMHVNGPLGLYRGLPRGSYQIIHIPSGLRVMFAERWTAAYHSEPLTLRQAKEGVERLLAFYPDWGLSGEEVVRGLAELVPRYGFEQTGNMLRAVLYGDFP